jgi:hypothetical protein
MRHSFFLISFSLACAGCDSGLASLWRAPAVKRVIQPGLAVPLWDQVSLVRSDRQPPKVRTPAGDHLMVTDQVSLGDGIWLVRTGLVLGEVGGVSALDLVDSSGAIFNRARLSKVLADRTVQSIGLRLDAHLRVLKDHLDRGRTGVVTGCDGLPVRNALQLRACLALHSSTDDVALSFGALWSDAGVTPRVPVDEPRDGGGLVDTPSRGRGLDAGATPRSADGG